MTGEMADAAAEAGTPIAPSIDNRKVEPGTETILLVEDEANLRYLARQYLEKQGYKVIEAADGAVAMQIAVAHEKVIHLLLTDVIMPGMNGRELAQRIAEIRPNVKILYMSGYTENVIGHNGMLDAGIRLLQKPFNLRDLKSMVREVLDATPTPLEVVMNTQSATPLRAARAREIPPTRAQRFQLHLPLRYRRLGEKDWHVGTTENISRSGMLFEADEVLQPNSQLEINLVLPQEIAGRVVTLKLRSTDFRIVTRRRTLPFATQTARTLFAESREMLATEARGKPWRLIGVGISDIVPAESAGGELFDGGESRALSGERAVDTLRGRFGAEAIIMGRSLKR